LNEDKAWHRIGLQVAAPVLDRDATGIDQQEAPPEHRCQRPPLANLRKNLPCGGVKSAQRVPLPLRDHIEISGQERSNRPAGGAFADKISQAIALTEHFKDATHCPAQEA
jgi:hypothetical protein